MKTCLPGLIRLFILGVIGVWGGVAQVCQAECPPRSSGFSVQLVSPIGGTAENIWFIASVSNGNAPIQVQFVVVTNILGQAANIVLATVTNSPYVFVGNQTNMPPLTYPSWGTYEVLTAVATDAVGNSATSAPVMVGGIQGNTYGVQSGSTIASPMTGTVVPVGAPLTISTFFRDVGGILLPVDFYAGTNFLGTVNPWPGLLMFTRGISRALTPYTLTISNLAPGNYDLTTRSGNPVNPYEYGVSPPVHITVLPANIPPTVSFVSLAYRATAFTAGSAIRVEAQATDRDGTVTQVNFYAGPAVNGPIVTSLGTATNAPFVLLLTNQLASGYHALRAEAVDDGGQTNNSVPATILVTTNEGGPPVVDIVSPPNGTRLAVGANFSVQAQLTVSDNNVNPVEFYSGTNMVGSVLNPPYRLILSNLAVGTYTLSARIKSLSGLASTGAVAQVTMSDFLLQTSGFDAGGNLRLRIGGLVPGTTNELQFSPDLINWATLATNVVTTNYWDYVDLGVTNDCERFYRCLRIP